MGTDQMLRMRKDTNGLWHAVGSTPCEECGCLFDYSLDEPGVVWEAGARVDDRCLNELCTCHLMPIQGLPFKLNFAS
jgi:hypothetical protein